MDEEEEQKEAPKDPTLALFLGLYLILLAFFVLLNTMATLKEDRVKAVMGSLLATFSSEILNTLTPTEFTASIGQNLAVDEYHQEVRDFFEVAVPLARIELFSDGRVMRIKLPADQLFEANSATLRADRQDLVNRIIQSLSRRAVGLRYEMEFSTFTGPFLSDEIVSGRVLQVARAGAFARGLVARAVPAESILIGAQPGDPSMVEMTFFVRVVEQAKVDFRSVTVTPQRIQ